MSLTFSEAIKQLFGIKVSDYPTLRNVLHKMEECGVIVREKNDLAYDKHKYFNKSELIAIHNTTILHALLSQTKKIKEVFIKPEKRQEHAESSEKILSLPFFKELGLRDNVPELIEMLKSDECLKTKRLPNPFIILPQVEYGSKHSTIIEVGLKCSCFSIEYKMMRAFIDKDAETAYSIASKNVFETNEARDLQSYIISKYEAASKFKKFFLDII